MAVLALLCFILFAGSAYSSPSRIVGGTETTIEKYPGIVAMENFNLVSEVWDQGCAANVLTTRYLVTAAHCFPFWLVEVMYHRIRAGSSIREAGGSIHLIDEKFIHPTFSWQNFDGDIAVIRVSNPLVYGVGVQPVTIVPQGYLVPDNAPVVHVGWGRTLWEGEFSPVLLETQVYTINNALCAARYLEREPNPGIVTENMICAGLLDVGGKGPCQGDSGGPLYFYDVLVGVVSWGHRCANETYPAASAAISSYSDWIVSVAV